MPKANAASRLKIQAARILNSQMPEWDVSPEDIRPATGSWRTDLNLGVFRWELYSQTKKGHPLVMGSYDTLTVFVRDASRFGFIVIDNFEIAAKEG